MQKLKYPAIVPIYTPKATPRVPRAPLPPLGSRTPFFRDPEHTRPTKWSLYRPLLRSLGGVSAMRQLGEGSYTVPSPTNPYFPASPGSPSQADILPALRARWRRGKQMTSIPRTRTLIETEESLLSALKSSSDLSAFAKSAKAELLRTIPPPPKPTRRPFLTGAFMRPTILNPPLPRLKPQPTHISMMMKTRAMKRERKLTRQRDLKEIGNTMVKEVSFWRELGVDQDWGAKGREGSWWHDIGNSIAQIDASFARDAARAASVFPKEVEEKIMAARRRRHAAFDERGRKRREGRE